jgi:hypothetical protein
MYGLLLLAILGGLPNLNLSDKIPEYLTVLQNSLKYYVCFFLIIRFNPFTRSKGAEFNDFDADMVFSSAIFLLLTTSFTSIVYTHVLSQIKNPLKNSPFNMESLKSIPLKV